MIINPALNYTVRLHTLEGAGPVLQQPGLRRTQPERNTSNE